MSKFLITMLAVKACFYQHKLHLFSNFSILNIKSFIHTPAMFCKQKIKELWKLSFLVMLLNENHYLLLFLYHQWGILNQAKCQSSAHIQEERHCFQCVRSLTPTWMRPWSEVNTPLPFSCTYKSLLDQQLVRINSVWIKGSVQNWTFWEQTREKTT